MASTDADEQTTTEMTPVVTGNDIVFNCRQCGGELVVDREGEGMEVPCPRCGTPLIIPAYQPAPNGVVPTNAAMNVESAPLKPRFDFSGFSAEQMGRRLEELRHQLKENRSQDVEMRGHVNRATNDLNRLQLKLQKLQERQSEIESELSAAYQHAPGN